MGDGGGPQHQAPRHEARPTSIDPRATHPVGARRRPAASARQVARTTRSTSSCGMDQRRVRSAPVDMVNSVRVGPGQTATALTPVPRSSSATASAKCSAKALVAAYVAM